MVAGNVGSDGLVASREGRVVYLAVMTVSYRHDVSCRDGPLRHDTIGST
jgi:hypothetical protein